MEDSDSVICILNLCKMHFKFVQVGAKSRNIAHLKGKVPSWVNIPTSVALPFGVFEKVLSDDLNQVILFPELSACIYELSTLVA